MRALLVVLIGLGARSVAADGPPLLKGVPEDFATVEIRAFCNMGWADETAGDGRGGWSDQGENDMRNAPLGLRDCRGVPFELIDPADNDGKSVIVFRSANFANGAAKVTIPLTGKAQHVYVLQAAAWLSGGAAKFTLEYGDGTRSKTLQAWEGIRVCNWWSPEDGRKYKVAFTVPNPVRKDVGMVVMEWRNEAPEKPLKGLLIETYDKETVMIVGGVTLSSRTESAFTGGSPVVITTPSAAGPPNRQRFFYPPASPHEDARNWAHVRRWIEAFRQSAREPNGIRTISDALLADEEQDEIYSRIRALAYLVEYEQEVDASLVRDVFDDLQTTGELRATIIAADLLQKTLAATSAADGRVSAFPDDVCERAAALLSHPDPVVQAMAEWSLALRFRKNNMTNRLGELFPASARQKHWFRAWWERGTDSFLTDDYCRQLVHLDRHRTLEGIRTETDRIEARTSKLVAAPGSRGDQVGELENAFRQTLGTMRAAIARKDLLAAHQAYPVLRLAARRLVVACRAEFPAEGIAFMTNYRIPGGDWNVNMPVTNATNIPCGDIYWKAGGDPAVKAMPFGLQTKIGDGSVRGIDLSWDVDLMVFSYWNQPIDPKIVPQGWNTRRNAHIYELDVATGAVRQLTDSPGNNDIEPCYLPSGDVVFASDRSSFGNQCAGPFIQDKRCTTLFRLDPKRSNVPVAISNNKDFDRFPHVLNDGTVVFMHWEYQERDLYNLHTAWRCRPDGTNMDALYKQHIAYPMSIRGVRQAPDSHICVATAQGHHDSHIGPVIIFDPSLGINDPDAMQLVTPGVLAVEGGLGPLYGQVVSEGGVENRGGSYIDPFPMSSQAFLVGHDMDGTGGYRRGSGMSEFAIYYIDVWGNRELIHRDKEMSCFMPHPLRKRQRPPVVADSIKPDATFATAFVENVYRDLPGVEKGAVKYLRISQRLMLPAPVDYADPDHRFNHLHWQPGDSTAMHFGYWTFAPTRTIGFVKVAPDGSAYFKVPAGTPVYLQALDENYCEVRRMRTSFTLQRGELRSCIGCHESRLQAAAPQSVYSRGTLSAQPQTPVPPPWGDCTVQDYQRDIQPIFDKHCISCHGDTKPKAELDLTGRPSHGFTQSYRSLFGFGPGDPQLITDLELHKDLHPDATADSYVSDRKKVRAGLKLIQQSQYPGQLISISDKNSRDASVTQPYQFGTNRSKLIRKLLDDPEHQKIRAEISQPDWLALVTWIDHNANFHSTLMDKSRYQREKVVTRVPYYLPDPWVPADLNPSFYNRRDTPIIPSQRRGEDARP